MTDDLGLARVLGADAVGQPGQRRFRLFVRSSNSSAILWMEKEYLNRLSLTLDQVLAYITEGQVLRTEAHASELPQPRSMPADFPLSPTYDFQVGEIRLNFIEADATFQLTAVPMEVVMDSDREPQVAINEDEAIVFSFTLVDAQHLSRSITALIAAGRPVCPFCQTPLDDGPHACVKQNGHRDIIQIEGDENEE
jgi:uncharacterized repeat protein (TIGR03847 family)